MVTFTVNVSVVTGANFVLVYTKTVHVGYDLHKVIHMCCIYLIDHLTTQQVNTSSVGQATGSTGRVLC